MNSILCINVDDYQFQAKTKLPKMVYDYYASGAEDEVTLVKNRTEFQKILLIPRVLVNVSNPDLSIEVFNQKVNFPIMVAATAMQKMAHPEGEKATAKACQNMGTIYTMSSLSTSSLEEVTSASNGPKWFQLYVFKDRSVSERLIRKVESFGFEAICLTVDTPFLGRRENDIRNNFSLPYGLNLELFRDCIDSELPEGLNSYVAQMLDSSLDWKTIQWLRSVTKLPILVKGILAPQDAVIALENGVDGIIVSNHGARQLDTSIATIQALPQIVQAVKGKIPVFLDGGIRRGTDVLKALALGAKAVMIGRPILWGLAVNGEKGVMDVLRLLKEEFQLAMALSGCRRISDITTDVIWKNDSKL